MPGTPATATGTFMAATRTPGGMVDFALSEENREIRRRARAFTEAELRSRDLQARERIEDPYERFPWDVIEAGSAAGLRELAVPEAYGGPDASAVSLALAAEELGFGDVAVSTTFAQCWRVCTMLAALGTDDQAEAFFEAFTGDDRYIPAIAMTEPAHGSNNTLPYAETGLDTTAERTADGWVIDGRKRYITNSPVASLLIVMANTAPDRGRLEGTTMFLVPTETDGVSTGQIYEKVGERLKLNGEVVLDGCEVPETAVHGTVDRAFAEKQDIAPGRVYSSARFLGLATAAYDEARRFAEDRVQGGAPVVEHDTVATRFAEMALRIETLRSLVLRAARAFEDGRPERAHLIDLCKVAAAETARDVTEMAVSTLGGSGVMADYRVEKYARDAMNAGHAEGHEDILKLRVGRRATADVVRGGVDG